MNVVKQVIKGVAGCSGVLNRDVSDVWRALTGFIGRSNLPEYFPCAQLRKFMGEGRQPDAFHSLLSTYVMIWRGMMELNACVIFYTWENLK